MALIKTGVDFRATGVSPLVSGLRQIRQEQARLGQTIVSTGKASSNSAKGVGQFYGALTAPSRTLDTIGSSINRLGRQFESLGRTMSRLGIFFSVAFSIPVIAAIGGSIKAFTEFEDELLKINTLVGLSGRELDLLVNGLVEVTEASAGLAESGLARVERTLPGLKDLVGITGISLGELTKAAFAATSAQLSLSDSLELVGFAAKASQIGLGETSKITIAAAGAMQAFGIGAEEAIDTLVLAVRFGLIEVDSFASQIGKMAGTATLAGLTFQDATAFISGFTLAGVSAREATTAFRAVLIAIIKPSEKAKEALARINVSAESVLKSLGEVGLTRTLIDLREQFAKAGVPFTDFIGNVRGMAGAAFVTSEEFKDAFQNISDNIENFAEAGGVTLSGFEAVTQSTSFRVKLLKANANLLAIEIGSVLAPAFNRVLEAITPVVLAFTEFARENSSVIAVIAVIAGLVAIMGPLLLIGGLLVTTFGGIIAAVGSLVSLFAALISPIGLVVAALGILATALSIGVFAGLVDFAENTELTFVEIGKRALTWGSNIAVNLARGLIQGATEIIKAINIIGQIFVSWLSPGSPPKLLPDLPDWGENIMNELLGGLFNADLASTFRELSGVVEQAIRDNVVIDTDAIGQILDFREAFAGVILQIQELGDAAPIKELVATLGIAEGSLTNYLETMLQLAVISEQVAEAQAEILKINQQFDENIAPLNKELQGIRDRREEVKEQLRIEELQGILADQRSTPLAQELALMELREILLEGQIDTEEKLRQAALDESQAKLDAIQAEQAALEEQGRLQEELLGIQQEQLNLFGELKQILEEIANVVGSLGDKLGGGGGVGSLGDLGIDPSGIGDIELPDPDDLDLAGLLSEGAAEGVDAIVAEFNRMVEELKAPIDDLKLQWEELKKTWGSLVDDFISGELDFPDFPALETSAFEFEGAMVNVGEAIQAIVDGPAKQLKLSFDRIVEGFQETRDLDAAAAGGEGFLAGLLSGLASLAGAIAPSISSFIIAWEQFIALIVDMVVIPFEIIGNIIMGNFSTAVAGFFGGIIGFFGRAIAVIVALVGVLAILITNGLNAIFGTDSDALSVVNQFVDFILEKTQFSADEWLIIMNGWLDSLVTWSNGMDLEFSLWVLGVIASLQTWKTDATAIIKLFFDEVIPVWKKRLGEMSVELDQWALDSVSSINTFVIDSGESFRTWIAELQEDWDTFWADLFETVTTWVDDFNLSVDTALADVLTLIQEFSLFEAMKTLGSNAVKGFLEGLKGLAEAVGDAFGGASEQVSEELGENSASTVYRKKGRNTALGYTLGIRDLTDMVRTATSQMVAVPQQVSAPTSVTNSANINFGGVNINNGTDQVVFEARVRRVLENALGD